MIQLNIEFSNRSGTFKSLFKNQKCTSLLQSTLNLPPIKSITNVLS